MIQKLKKDYETVCNEYLKIFCEKQELEFDDWVADEVGGIACCSDFYFNFHDIVHDVNVEAKAGIILSWYYDSIDNPDISINYYSYEKGLRFEDLKEKSIKNN